MPGKNRPFCQKESSLMIRIALTSGFKISIQIILAFCSATIASAEISKNLINRLSNPEQTILLENQIANVLDSKGKLNLEEMLAGTIEKDVNEFVDSIEALSLSKKQEFVFKEATPCFFAGLTLRILAIRLANGEIKPFKTSASGQTTEYWLSTNPDIFESYSNHMHRCQIIRGITETTPRIGTFCNWTGICPDELSASHQSFDDQIKSDKK